MHRELLKMFISRVVERTGRTVCFAGRPIEDFELTDEQMVLPLIIRQADATARVMGKPHWIQGVSVVASQTSLAGIAVEWTEPSPGPLFPLFALARDSIHQAVELSPDPSTLDFAVLEDSSAVPEVTPVVDWASIQPTL